MPRRPLLALLALLAAASTRAGATDQGGSVALTFDAYRSGEPGRQGWIRALYALDVEPRPWLFLKLAAILEAETHGEIRRDRIFDESDRGLARAPLRFRDLAVGFRAGGTTVVLGRQRLTWKRATFVNATDNLSPRDWTDPLEEARLSPIALDAVWERARFSVEGALVPRHAPSRLPRLGGRWFDTGAAGIDLAWGRAEFPPIGWDTLQGGVRGGYRGPRGEARVSYFRGFDDAPRLIPVGASLDRRIVKLEVTGLDGEVLIGPFVLRGEAGYFHFPGGADDGYGLFEVEGEWAGSGWRVIAGYGDAVGGHPETSVPSSLDLAFLPAVFLHLEKGEPTEWQVALDTTVGTNAYDALVRLSGSYPFSGHLRAGGELDLLGGGPATFWGRWRGNDRLRVFVRFDY